MERPILFSGPMVRAILDGRKTQTRRVLKPQPEPPPMEGGKWHVRNRHGGCFCPERDIGTIAVPYCPIAEGDELWVREAHALVGNVDPPWVLYRANGYEAECERLGFCNFPPEPEVKWRPSIHMPRWASRITLRVTGVKVERLQDITQEDALAEGVHPDDQNWHAERVYGGNMPVHLFGMLWESINGPGSWDRNDWVVAYTFERVLPK